MHARGWGPARPSCLASLAVLACTSCYSTWDIAPTELQRLDGYRAPAAVRLRDRAGSDDQVRFDKDTVLRFSGEHHEPEQYRFAAIGPVYPQALVGVEARAGRPVTVDLTDVTTVTASRFSTGKTVALTVVVSTVATSAAIAITLAAVSKGLGGGGFGGFSEGAAIAGAPFPQPGSGGRPESRSPSWRLR